MSNERTHHEAKLQTALERLPTYFGKMDSDNEPEAIVSFKMARKAFADINVSHEKLNGFNPQLNFREMYRKADESSDIDPDEYEQLLNEVTELRAANQSFATMEKAYQQKIAVLQKRVDVLNKPKELWQKTKDTITSINVSVSKKNIASLALGSGIAGVGWLAYSYWDYALVAGVGGLIGGTIGGTGGEVVGGIAGDIYDEYFATSWSNFQGQNLRKNVVGGCQIIGAFAGAAALCYYSNNSDGFFGTTKKEQDQKQKKEVVKPKAEKPQSFMIDSRHYPSADAAQAAYKQTATSVVGNRPGLISWPDAVNSDRNQAVPVSLAPV